MVRYVMLLGLLDLSGITIIAMIQVNCKRRCRPKTGADVEPQVGLGEMGGSVHCAIYRSGKKLDTYLYVERKDDFARVPSQLMGMLGRLEWVMDLDLATRQRLAIVDVGVLRVKLKQEGFFLQIPPAHYQLI